jgi:ribosomal protein L3 glutamine methyltransferase
MGEVFHTRGTVRGRRPQAQPSVGTLIAQAAQRLRRARVFFGHGTDNARDEAAFLVLHALALPPGGGPELYRRRVGVRAAAGARELISQRIATRVPAAYLTGVAYFAGLPFTVDARVLIPRSPLAELIEHGFAPWMNPAGIRRVLDVGTGSGCIAIACAHYLRQVHVDALDVSAEALEVAGENVRRHRLTRRVHLVRSDHFRALKNARYDIIVANPPYVGKAELHALPAEYRHEPQLALAAGRDGLDSIRIILSQAARHLNPGGVLIVEVGNTEQAVRCAWPQLPFVWLQFGRGGGGVFLLTRAALQGQKTRKAQHVRQHHR